MNKYALTGLAWILSLSATAYYVHDYTTAKQAERRLEAVNIALSEQQRKHDEVSQIESNKYKKLASSNTALNATLDELRKRSARLSEPSRVQCAGSTGTELSRPDANFLARYSARAEWFRLEWKACKEYAESLQR